MTDSDDSTISGTDTFEQSIDADADHSGSDSNESDGLDAGEIDHDDWHPRPTPGDVACFGSYPQIRGASSATGSNSSSNTSNSNSDSQPMTKDVDNVSVWKSDDSPAHRLYDATLEVTDDYVKIRVPRSRFKRQDDCPKHPNGYQILATKDGDPVYEGEVAHSQFKSDGMQAVIMLKCNPAELVDN